MISLSKRLSAIKALVPDGARACDVGTDHGYLAINLIKSGKCPFVIATDINQKPLKNAEKNIKKYGAECIKLIQSDGLHNVDISLIDTAIIAGMGGEVISGIIERDLPSIIENGIMLILQPTTSPEFLRKFLFKKGFKIIDELPIMENNKLYSVMSVKYIGGKTDVPLFKYYIGNITPLSDDGKKYINKQYNRLKQCYIQLENNSKKAKEYNLYKTICKQIQDYLNTF